MYYSLETFSECNRIPIHTFTGYFFSGVSYCNDRERVFIFVYDTKEKENQNTRQSYLFVQIR
jgi:hypothetical protein